MLRRHPRAAVLWVAALCTAVVTSTVVARDLASLHRRANADDRATVLVVAARDLALGETVGDADVDLVHVPASARPDGALPRAGDAVGRVVRTPVLAGTALLDRHLAEPGRSGLAAAVPPGMRAMRVAVDGGLVPPAGATVDVLVTFEADRVPADTDPTLVVAAGALVVAAAVDEGSSLRSDHVAGPVGVTLLVTAEEARRLAFASAGGVLTLALTPPEDACCRRTSPAGP